MLISRSSGKTGEKIGGAVRGFDGYRLNVAITALAQLLSWKVSSRHAVFILKLVGRNGRGLEESFLSMLTIW